MKPKSKKWTTILVSAGVVVLASLTIFVGQQSPDEKQQGPTKDSRAGADERAVVRPAPLPAPGPAGGGAGVKSGEVTGSASDESRVLEKRRELFGRPGAVRARPPASNEPKDRLAAIDEILGGLDVGHIAFNAPNRMAIDEPTTIQLVLGVKKTLEELKKQITAQGEKIEAEVRVSDRMEARLSGSDFSITALTPGVQLVSRNEATEWKWEVTPKKSGKHVLHLTLDVLLNIEGSIAARNLRTFDREIEVQVSWSTVARDFVKDNWQWLWATVLVPLAPWIWKKVKRTQAGT